MDRRVLRVQPLLAQLEDLRLAVAELHEPLVVADLAVAELGGELAQRVLRIALDADVDAAVAPELVGIDIDRDHLRGRVDAASVAQAEVDHRAGKENDVRLPEGRAPGAAHEL